MIHSIKLLTNLNIVQDKNYLYLRNMDKQVYNNLIQKNNIINNNWDKKEFNFIISPDSYLTKLYLGININKYDLLLNGNMGFNGNKRIIKELNDICNKNKCTFHVSKNIIFNKKNQFSKEIYDYVINTYTLTQGSSYYDIYKNNNIHQEK